MSYLASTHAFFSCELRINSKKCAVLHVAASAAALVLGSDVISIDCSSVPVVKEFFLCVTLDAGLLGDAYLRRLRGRLSGSIAAIVRVRHLLPLKILVLLYHAFFASYLSYGIEAFGRNYSNRLYPIAILQKRAIRIIANQVLRDHSAEIFSSLGILPYMALIKYSVCVLTLQILSSSAPSVASFVSSNGSTREPW